jgi:hypothetical protein
MKLTLEGECFSVTRQVNFWGLPGAFGSPGGTLFFTFLRISGRGFALKANDGGGFILFFSLSRFPTKGCWLQAKESRECQRKRENESCLHPPRLLLLSHDPVVVARVQAREREGMKTRGPLSLLAMKPGHDPRVVSESGGFLSPAVTVTGNPSRLIER